MLDNCRNNAKIALKPNAFGLKHKSILLKGGIKMEIIVMNQNYQDGGGGDCTVYNYGSASGDCTCNGSNSYFCWIKF